jgi:hypothetical protein
MGILLRNDGAAAGKIKKGIRVGVFQAKQSKASEVTLIVGKKGTFVSNYGPILGEAWAQKLAKDEAVTYKGVRVRLESIGTLTYDEGKNLVALHISEDDMIVVNDLAGRRVSSTCPVLLPRARHGGEVECGCIG